MKYNNYALALVLLASSAFASFKISTDQELIALAGSIFTAAAGLPNISQSQKKKWVFNNEFFEKNCVELTENQKNALLNVKNVKSSILEALKKCNEKDLEGYVKFIFNKVNENEITSEDINFYGTISSHRTFDILNEFKNKSGGWPLSEDEIKHFLKEAILPTLLTPAQKLLKVANDGKISGKQMSLYGTDLKEDQFKAIEKFEKYSERLLSEPELESFLDSGSLPPFTVDERLKAILALSSEKVGELSELKEFANDKQIEVIKTKEAESNSRISEDLLRQIFSSNDDVLENLVVPPILPVTEPEKVTISPPLPSPPAPSTDADVAAKILALVKNCKIEEASRSELLTLGVTENQIEKLIAAEVLAKKEDIENVLKAVIASTKTASQTTVAEKIFALVEANQIAEVKRGDLDKLNLSEAQIKALLAAKDLDSVAKIDAILNPAAPAATIINYAGIMPLVKDGKIDPKHKAALMNLNLTSEQADKLLAASGLDSEVKIKEVLNPATENSKVPTNGGATKKSESSSPTILWPWILCAILLVSAIGGGSAYMMTRKTDGTDL